jgi:hypothetical protein
VTDSPVKQTPTQKFKQYFRTIPRVWKITVAVIGGVAMILGLVASILGIIDYLERHPSLTPWIVPTPTSTRTATLPPTSTPTFTVLPTPTKTPTLTPTPTPTITPTLGILAIAMPTQARLGSDITVTIQTLPEALCEIEFIMPSGKASDAAELESKKADSSGICSWTWNLSANMAPGPGEIVIRVEWVESRFPILIVN